MASGNKLLVNQLLVQALKLRCSTAGDNKMTAEPVNREKASVVAKASLTLRAIGQRENRQR